MHTLNSPPPARLRIPVIISLPQLGEVEKHIADFVKQDWGKEIGQSMTKSMGTTVWWDPLDWKIKDSHLTARFHIHAQGDKSSTGTADKTPKDQESLVQKAEKDIKVEVDSVLKWSKDWRLEAPDFQEGETNTVNAEKEPDKKRGEKLLRKGTAKLHESLRKRTEDIEAKARELWNEIQEPIRMAEDIWLQIVPDNMSVSSTRIIADFPYPRMESIFEISIQPNVIIGKKPFPLKGDLPAITDYKPGPPGFHIETNLKISFKEVNKLLLDPKVGLLKKALPGGGNHNAKITNINIYGSGGKLVVEAQVEYNPVINLGGNPAQLTVYLVGTPTYHPEERLIDFPDMDFDIKTSDFLVQMAEMFDRDGIRQTLREKAVIPVGANLDKLKEDLTKLLNRPLGHFARLKTTVDSLTMEEAFVSDYGIEGRVALDGDAAVVVNW